MGEKKDNMKTIRVFENEYGKLEMISNAEGTNYGVYLNDRCYHTGGCFGEAMRHFVNIMYNMQNNLNHFSKY